MRYETFPTAQAALARVAEHRAAGQRSYAIALRDDCHQVRSWA